jgi:predicted nucleic acid-binding protein
VTIVVDASVAIKWVIDEAGSQSARRLVADDELLVAPDFLIVECANILWSASRRGRITSERARAALLSIEAVPIHFLSASKHVGAAQTLAIELGHPVYDALYLAVALVEHAVVVTADRGFIAAVTRHGTYSHLIRPLEPG